MARKAETNFSSRVKSDLQALERTGHLWHVKVQQVGIRGTPDYIVNAYGSFVSIELKRNDVLAPDALQQYNLNKIKATNGFAFVASPENWDSIMDKIINICVLNQKKSK